MTIGERIKQLRGDMTLTEFASIFKVGASNISAIENNKSLPSNQLAIAICEHFNCSLDWLLRGIEEIEIKKAVQEPKTDYIPINQYLDILQKYNKLLEQQIVEKDEKIREQQLHK